MTQRQDKPSKNRVAKTKSDAPLSEEALDRVSGGTEMTSSVKTKNTETQGSVVQNIRN
jgi:hypothetical protein